jgi:alcohol dehydrogenase class IV
MVKEQPTWYEMQYIQDLMPILNGRAVRGIDTAYFLPNIYIGKSAVLKACRYLEAILNKEERRALIITDSFTSKFVKNIDSFLDLIEMEYQVWSGALPEVPINTIEEGVRVCESFKPSVLIAIGGGSVMDTAKGIMIKYENPEENLHMILAFSQTLGLRKKIKKLVAIPTTSGTGSEAARAAILTDTNRDPPKKLIISHDELLADIAILDTDFVKDLPPFLTMATGLDALAHAIGAYTTNWGNPYTDATNLTTIKEIVTYLPRAYKYGGRDNEARSHMQVASTWAAFGANGNSNPGLNHGLGHSFGKVCGVHHGISVIIFVPYTIAFKAKITERWKDICPIFGIDCETKDDDALLREFIHKLKDFMHSLDCPTCVKEIKDPVISKEDYFNKMDILVDYTLNDAGSLTTYRPSNKELLRKIFEYAWDGKEINF